MYHFAFVMDQQVGLRTQSLNYQRVVEADPTISATWVPVCYSKDIGLLGRLPGLPSWAVGTVRGIREIRDGLAAARRAFDGLLWASWAAKSVPDLVASARSYLVMDMTPLQMEQMGALYGYTRARSRFLGSWKRRATQLLYEKATHFFPWNDWVAGSLVMDYGIPAHRITPVSPGVDTRLYRPGDARAEESPVRLLFVGGDFNRKGGDLLLKWASETRVRGDWELHVVTRDPVPEHPRIHIYRDLKNHSPELIRLYQTSDLFVLPTRADCYSLVALEAMACGLPVVISDLGGISSIVRHGETGLLMGDPSRQLGPFLEELIGNSSLRRSMGEAALARARSEFDTSGSVQTVLTAMKEGGLS